MKIARVSTVPIFIVTQLKGQIEFLTRSGIDLTVISSDVSDISEKSFLHHIFHVMEAYAVSRCI